MAKFSGTQTVARPKASVKTKTTRIKTKEGGDGFERDAKSELFLLAISNMVSADTFYEKGTERDTRYRNLIHEVTREDPEWVSRFVPYLRNTMNMRTASLVMAVEYGVALKDVDRDTLKQSQYPRHVLNSALFRSDEPSETVGFYFNQYGKNLPMWLKRGLSDATHRLYNERNALKYDGQSKDIRFGDVIELTHAKPKDGGQSKLFRYLIERRHKRENISTEGLEMIERATELQNMPVENRRSWLTSEEFNPELLELAGFTWERLSGWLQGPMDAKAWEAIIPSMQYMATIRNLRNFEEAGISNKMVDYVIGKITDPEQVKKSRQFPIRFYSAFKATNSLKWASALERALELSLENVPYLKGSTLILIDTSSSMSGGWGGQSKVENWELASLFGIALAQRCEKADTYTYNDKPAAFHPGKSILLDMKSVEGRCYGGTDTFGSLDRTYKGQDRIVILTDEQAHPAYFGITNHNSIYSYYDTTDSILNKITCPIYTFNVAGYQTAQMENGKNGRYAFGGLNDSGFKMIELLENYKEQNWPWMD